MCGLCTECADFYFFFKVPLCVGSVVKCSKTLSFSRFSCVWHVLLCVETLNFFNVHLCVRVFGLRAVVRGDFQFSKFLIV